MRGDARRWLVTLWILWAGALAACAYFLQCPSPLFLNLGPGDEPFAHGFRSAWERDGLKQTGETIFRWTLDGASLDLPVDVRSGRLFVRLRLARFSDTPVHVTLFVNERSVESWDQPPRGWQVRSIDIGEPRGPLKLRFRSSAADESPLGIALDWVEVRGAKRIVPLTSQWCGLLAWLLAVPLLVGIATRRLLWLGGAAAVQAILAATAVGMDRLAGLAASAWAGPAALAAMGLVIILWAIVRRAWAEYFGEGAGALGVPLALTACALLLLGHPFYYYPDVDTHARLLAAIRADPHTIVDAHEFQARTGAWTRQLGDRRIAFPYSPGFHVIAWPLALEFGNVGGVKILGCAAVGMTAILVFGIARALSLNASEAILAQALFASLPVVASRLTLALFPTLLAQALEAALLLSLISWVPQRQGARGTAAICLFLFVPQIAYTGSLLNVGTAVMLFALLETIAGEGRRAARLLGAYVAALVAVLVLQYAAFLPALVRDVLPHAREVSAAAPAVADVAGGTLSRASMRLALFYDAVYPILIVIGAGVLRAASPPARRVLHAWALSGLVLLLGRFILPSLLRDAKEIELLAVPTVVFSAGALAWVARRRGFAAFLAPAVATGLLVWGLMRGAAVYADRFIAVGR